MQQPTLGSLFAGIGGFDVGFENACYRSAWQVELNPVNRAVLADRFRHARQFEDVRQCGAHNLSPVDVITAGFPCQDISVAGWSLRTSLTCSLSTIAKTLKQSSGPCGLRVCGILASA
ncbi:DNA cytosine methyltransferase [Pseudomonas brassicacearum]|uniref:DNA cytosine methyltransferase n=1 Tax=Pseudomonas brassicacearum TaxID=930166 RepID=UPI000F46C724|nr:DNA cytosine methyltransferase [Pseudomonas brassicacearum]